MYAKIKKLNFNVKLYKAYKKEMEPFIGSVGKVKKSWCIGKDNVSINFKGNDYPWLFRKQDVILAKTKQELK